MIKIATSEIALNKTHAKGAFKIKFANLALNTNIYEENFFFADNL